VVEGLLADEVHALKIWWEDSPLNANLLQPNAILFQVVNDAAGDMVMDNGDSFGASSLNLREGVGGITEKWSITEVGGGFRRVQAVQAFQKAECTDVLQMTSSKCNAIVAIQQDMCNGILGIQENGGGVVLLRRAPQDTGHGRG
jgi:hypothetical protein